MKHHLLKVACVAGGLLASAGPLVDAIAQTPIEAETEGQRLMQLSRAWSDSVAAGKLETTIDWWAEDAVVMAPGQPPLRGRAAIRDFVVATAEMPGFTIAWEPLEAHVSSSGDMAYLLERNRITMADSTGALLTTYNKVVTIWKRQDDGSWKNVIDMWNADPTPW